MAMLFEEWRKVKGFEDCFLISSQGRLMSKCSGVWRLRSLINKNGDYLSVVLQSGNKRVSTRVHRLVYTAFVSDIPDGKKYHVHHLDGNKQNNHVDNLALVTAKEHTQEHIKAGTANWRAMNNYNICIRPRKIVMKDLEGNVLMVFNNAKDASRKTGVCGRNILQVASKVPYNKAGAVRKQAGGYIWEFVN